MDKSKIRLALGIISGRVDRSMLDADEWLDLGYDPDCDFGYRGMPDKDEIKRDAEEIILDALGGE